MAENKKSFILYCDLLGTISKLPDDQAGKLFKHILEYVNDKDPKIDDNLLLEVAFEPIKQTLKRDLQDWEKRREARSVAGKKGMEKRWNENNEPLQTITTDNNVINEVTNITVSDSVNVTVSDSVKIKENNIKERKLKFSHTLSPYLEKYGKDMLNDFYKYWTEPNASNTKFRKELERTWELSRRLETWDKNQKVIPGGATKEEKTTFKI